MKTMTRLFASALLAAVCVGCTDAPVIKIVDPKTQPVYDNSLRLTGKVCTSDPADLVFPLKVLFIIDTSQSMNVNDPVSTTEPDPLKQTARGRAMLQVISRFIDLRTPVDAIPKPCNTGTAGCDKGSTKCADCGVDTHMCIGPDCCQPGPGCRYPCPGAGLFNGTCVALCDVKKAGCGPGEKACPDCGGEGMPCVSGVCGKQLDPGVEFALMRFGSAKQVLTKNKSGEEGFTNDIKELVTTLPQLNNGGSVTDYEGALSLAFKTLSRDMAQGQKTNSAAVNRSKYVLVFLSDGQPDPKINDQADWNGVSKDLWGELLGTSAAEAKTMTGVITQYNVDTQILRRVKEIMSLKSVYHVGDIRFHSAYLAGQTPSWLQDEATSLLKLMADVGKGTFRNFQNGEDLNFLHIDFSSLRRIFRVKNLFASNLSARPSKGVLIADSDTDGMDDQLEEIVGTDPSRADTDGDGFADTTEHFFRASGWDALNPADADCSLLTSDLDGDGLPDDTDGDGLADCEERFLGTSKDQIDSDADGIPDGIEVRFGTNPVLVDTEDDLDFDGMPNGDEIRLHTDPRSDDAAHRSRESYRYSLHQVGTGIETLARRCAADTDCASGAGCREGYCRCTNEDSCSSLAKCTSNGDCQVAGETCENGVCAGLAWTCEAPAEKGTVTDNVCTAKKHVTCYEYDIENISLVTPRAPVGGEEGWNQVQLVFGEVPFDNPMDYGNYQVACVRARYLASTGAKLPGVGKLEVPETAWRDPKEAAKTYEATATDSAGGTQAECGDIGGAKVYCNPGDWCAGPSNRRCSATKCLCPDGKLGICPAPSTK